MLNETTCNNILKSNIWKTWSIEKIIRLQSEVNYPVVPQNTYEAAIKTIFKNFNNVDDFFVLYKQVFPRPLTLKEILSWLPKKMYFTRIK